MGKTFDEYWLETKQDYLGDLYCWAISPGIYGDLNVNEEDVKNILNLLWNDSRQNMTTTPGLSFCKDCGGPYSLHHDCKCGNCNG